MEILPKKSLSHDGRDFDTLVPLVIQPFPKNRLSPHLCTIRYSKFNCWKFPCWISQSLLGMYRYMLLRQVGILESADTSVEHGTSFISTAQLHCGVEHLLPPAVVTCTINDSLCLSILC